MSGSSLGEAAVAAEPDAALVVDQHRVDDVAQQTLSLGIASEIRTSSMPIGGRPATHATALRADPESTLRILGDRPGMVAAQALEILTILLDGLEGARLGNVTVEAATVGADPQVTETVFVQRQDSIVAQP